MSIIIGARTSSNTTSTNQAVDVDKRMRYIQDYQTPITQFFLMNKTGSMPVKNKRSKFEWHQKTPLQRTNVISLSGGSATEASIALATANTFRFGDTLLVESTGDMLIVTTAAPTTTIDVRKIGAGVITAVTSGTVRIISPAVKDDYARTTALTNNATNVYGYCQIGLDMISMSGREDAGEAYTDGEDFKGLFDEKATEITKYEERKFIYNGAAYDDSTNNITYSAGFRGVVTTNVKYITGELDETELLDILEQVMSKNDGGEVVGYAGSTYVRGLNKICKDAFQHQTQDYVRVYGGISKKGGNPRVLEYLSPWGAISFAWNPMFEGDFYANSCLFLNRKHPKLRFMKNDSRGSRKYRVEPDVEDPGTGVKSDQIMWDTGLDVGCETYHGWHLPSTLPH